MSERESRTFQRSAITRHRGHDATVSGSKPDLVAADDYVAFCEGLRKLCGIDLSQYKRPQMERRLRSFFARQGYAKLTDSLDRLRRRQAAARRAARPDHDQRLAAVAPPRAVDAARGRPAPGPGRERPRAGVERRVLVRRRGLHARRRLPPRRSRASRSGSSEPTSTSAWSARAKTGLFSSEDARSAPAAAMERWFERTPTGWLAKQSLRAMTHFEVGDLLKLQPPASSYELIMCRNTVIYFADQIRDELHARLAQALRPGGVLVIG